MSYLMSSYLTVNIISNTLLLGFAGGKFLEKGKYKNAGNNNQFFSPADFLIGKDVVINGYSFHINDCDEHTKKWYKGNYKPSNEGEQ